MSLLNLKDSIKIDDTVYSNLWVDQYSYHSNSYALILFPDNENPVDSITLTVFLSDNKNDGKHITLDKNRLGKNFTRISNLLKTNGIIKGKPRYLQSGYVMDYPEYELALDLSKYIER